MKPSKQTNLTKERLEEITSSLSYKFTSWYQYTWLGKLWYSVKQGIPQLFKWFKVIWKIRDWDDFFIFVVLEFQIKNTMNYVDKHKRHVNYKQDVFWMNLAINLIKKVKAEDYQIEYFDYIETKTWFKDIPNSEYSELKSKTLIDNLDDYFSKNKNWERRATEHIKKNQNSYTVDHTDRELVSRTIGHLKHKKAKKLLFDLLERKIEHWWD